MEKTITIIGRHSKVILYTVNAYSFFSKLELGL